MTPQHKIELKPDTNEMKTKVKVNGQEKELKSINQNIHQQQFVDEVIGDENTWVKYRFILVARNEKKVKYCNVK